MKFGTIFCALALFTAAPAASAATLIVDGSGELTGATGVDVGGTLYDVSFVDGTCIGLFSGCDELSDFTFTTLADAALARQALLDQVFIDGPAGSFDTNPELTLGCEADNRCLTVFPYGLDGPDEFRGAIAENTSLEAFDGLALTTSLDRDFDTGDFAAWTFAVWSISAVPEPSTWAMMLLGFGAAGFALRRRRRGIAAGSARLSQTRPRSSSSLKLR